MADHILTVPLTYYRDPALAQREHALLRHTPLALAPTAQLPNPNDFVVRDVLGTSVLLTRDSTGTAHAFLNYCRHRGGKPAPAGCGNARRHTCPYHAWSYDSAGRLVGLPGQEGFDGLARDDYGLVELPTEERHGFVWAVLTVGEPINVAAHLGPLDDELAAWDLGTCAYLTEKAQKSRRTSTGRPPSRPSPRTTTSPTSTRTASWARTRSPTPPSTTPTAATTGSASRARGSRAIHGEATTRTRAGLHGLHLLDLPQPHPRRPGSVGTEIIDILPADDAASPGRCVVRHRMDGHRAGAQRRRTRRGTSTSMRPCTPPWRNEDCGVLRGCGEGGPRSPARPHGHRPQQRDRRPARGWPPSHRR